MKFKTTLMLIATGSLLFSGCAMDIPSLSSTDANTKSSKGSNGEQSYVEKKEKEVSDRFDDSINKKVDSWTDKIFGRVFNDK